MKSEKQVENYIANLSERIREWLSEYAEDTSYEYDELIDMLSAELIS